MWLRTGECNRCGDCCKGDPFLGEEGDSTVEGYCPLLSIIDGQYTCTDRNHDYYLKGCNTFPSHPGQIVDKPNCSYKFTWIENASINT